MSTPGPWYWEKRGQRYRLYTPKNGSCTVMDFVRMGMQGAQPRFSDRNDRPLGGIMRTLEEIGDPMDNPDARLIAKAPVLLEACQHLLRAAQMRRGFDILSEDEFDEKYPSEDGWAAGDVDEELIIALEEAEEAIAEATGKCIPSDTHADLPNRLSDRTP